MKDDERGAMMLLTAVILVIAYLALSAVTTQAVRYGEDDSRSQLSPALQELSKVQLAVTQIANHASTNSSAATALHQLSYLEAAQGYSVNVVEVRCNPAHAYPGGDLWLVYEFRGSGAAAKINQTVAGWSGTCV